MKIKMRERIQDGERGAVEGGNGKSCSGIEQLGFGDVSAMTEQ